jgi:2-C-methyl-D-erythritol 4-phosphate cytidylyltransferase
MRYWLVMPAAGASERFGGGTPKQYAPLAGRTVIEWALAPFLADPRCAGLVVAIAPGDSLWAPLSARIAAGPAGRAPAVSAVSGGEQRSQSVRRALAALEGRAGAGDWVLVHDAARPCLERCDLERLLGQLAAHPLGGLLAVPVADTLKRAADAAAGTAGADGAAGTAGTAGAAGAAAPAVARTVERAGLWRAQTPQMFRYRRLCQALDAAHAAGSFPSDESQALEWLGEQPLLVAGAASNLKITSSADMALAAAVLRARDGHTP